MISTHVELLDPLWRRKFCTMTLQPSKVELAHDDTYHPGAKILTFDADEPQRGGDNTGLFACQRKGINMKGEEGKDASQKHSE